MSNSSFYLYIFTPAIRIDHKEEPFALMVPTTGAIFDVDKHNIPSGVGIRISYLAENIYSYNIDTDRFTAIKARNEMISGTEFQRDFHKIYGGNDVHIINHHIGDDVGIEDFLYNSRNYSVNKKLNKIMKVSIDGLAHPEVYLATLFDKE